MLISHQLHNFNKMFWNCPPLKQSVLALLQLLKSNIFTAETLAYSEINSNHIYSLCCKMSHHTTLSILLFLINAGVAALRSQQENTEYFTDFIDFWNTPSTVIKIKQKL